MEKPPKEKWGRGAGGDRIKQFTNEQLVAIYFPVIVCVKPHKRGIRMRQLMYGDGQYLCWAVCVFAYRDEPCEHTCYQQRELQLKCA